MADYLPLVPWLIIVGFASVMAWIAAPDAKPRKPKDFTQNSSGSGNNEMNF